MPRDSGEFSIDALCAEAARRLARLHLLDGQGDQRVAPAPDARTVRYYATLGLVDAPARAGRQARYGERQLRQLIAIKALQTEGLPLEAVRQAVHGRSDRELDAIGAAAGARSPTRKPPRASVMRWRELDVEPGLKVCALPGWSPTRATDEHLRTALERLTRAPKS